MILARKARIQLSLERRNFIKITVARDARLERDLTLQKGNLVTKDAHLGMKKLRAKYDVRLKLCFFYHCFSD